MNSDSVIFNTTNRMITFYINSCFILYLQQYMETGSCILDYILKTQRFESQQQPLALVQDIKYQTLSSNLVPVYRNSQLYPSLLPAVYQASQTDKHSIVFRKWGQPLSTLSQPQIHSYSKTQWLPNILKAYIDMSPFLPKLNKEDIFIDQHAQPKFLPLSCCSREEYVQNCKEVVKQLFMHEKGILERASKIRVLEDVEEWRRQLGPRRANITIEKLIQLKNSQLKSKEAIRIPLSQDEKTWVLSFTSFKAGQKLDLVYDGDKHRFDPAPLLQLAHKSQLLFLFQTSQAKRAAYWMSIKPQVNTSSIFGSYYADNSKKSVLLGLEKRSVHALCDENYAIGLGNEALISVGRADIVCSAFNCANVSFFPCSYWKDDEKGVATAEDLLGKEFILRQLQVYKIN